MRLLPTILNDLRRKAGWCYGSTTRRSLLKVIFTDGTAAMILYRAMQWSSRRGWTPLAAIFNKLNAIACHCVIGRGADFGPGLIFIHSNGIVINSHVRGGANVSIEHQVTIGAEAGQSPVLGDDVFIGAGAKIIGGVAVGDRVKIGANAVVIDNVPSDSTAVGVPARVVGRDALLRKVA